MTGGVTSATIVMVCMKVAMLPRSSSATHFLVMAPPPQGGTVPVCVYVMVSGGSSSAQLSEASTVAGGGRLLEQLRVIFCGSESGSNTGGRRSTKLIVKPNKALLPKLSTAW